VSVPACGLRMPARHRGLPRQPPKIEIW
jgi:hypothetical protein